VSPSLSEALRAARSTGTAVISGRVYDSAWEGVAGGGLPEVSWFVPLGGALASGSAMTNVDGYYTLGSVPPASGAGELWACRPSYAHPTSAAWRTGLSWQDGATSTFDFPQAQVPVDVQRGGPWSDWTRCEVVLDGADKVSPLHAYAALGATYGTVFPVPGRYTSGAVYFWASEGLELPEPMVVTPSAMTVRGIDFVDAMHGWTVGGPGLNDFTRQYTIQVTSDGGVTWTEQTTESPVGSLKAVDFFDLQHGCAVDETGALISTSDGGSDWKVSQGSSSTSVNGIDMVDSDTAWAVGGKGYPDYAGLVAHTDDGGETWNSSVVSCDYPLWDVEFTSAMKGWAVGGYGTIMRTTDGGATWAQQESGSLQELRAIAFSSPEHGCIVGGVTLVTTDGGETWVRGAALSDARDVAFADDAHGTATTSSGVFTTADGGLTWHRASDSTPGSSAFYACDYAGQNVWVGGASGHLCLSEDGGVEWTGTGISVSESDAQRVGVLSPASASTKPGGRVKVRMEHVPAGWTVDITGHPSFPASSSVKALKAVVSAGRERQDQVITVPGTAEPGYFYVVGLRHRGGPLYLETAVQLSTLKSSGATVARGGAVSFSGIVPTQGHMGSRAGKSKYVYLYKSTLSATRGFRLVKRYRANGYGKYTAGPDKPTKTSWYTVLYPGDGWYWQATTPVVKVAVK
jgi:photosystem II stability/assembly factor-like uncharacterized protein